MGGFEGCENASVHSGSVGPYAGIVESGEQTGDPRS
jgi:hypothetical protein